MKVGDLVKFNSTAIWAMAHLQHLQPSGCRGIIIGMDGTHFVIAWNDNTGYPTTEPRKFLEVLSESR